MKRLLTLLLLTAFFTSAKAQPAKKERAPTAAEMKAMMNDAQKMLDKLSPEEKRLMDSMGVKMPNLKAMPKVTDAQLARAWEDDKRIVPKRDAVRIAGLSKTQLTAASLPPFLASVNKAVDEALPASLKTKAAQLYGAVKKKYGSAKAVGNFAASLNLLGQPELALCVMGRACADDPANADNINNYASLLTTAGGEQHAVPLLDYLAKLYPGNTTVLNNLGQAWYGLGETAKAENYLDSAIRIYACHPQANLTKSFIEENKGNEPEAVEAVKRSLQHTYSREKEARLRSLGSSAKNGVGAWRKPLKDDGLGLAAFQHPAFPKSVKQCILLEPEWEKFRSLCNEEKARLNDKIAALEKEVAEKAAARQRAVMAIAKTALQAANPSLFSVSTVAPVFSAQATRIYAGEAELDLQKALTLGKERAAFMQASYNDERKRYEADMRALQKQDDAQTGEGKPNVDFCPKKVARADAFLKLANDAAEKQYIEKLSLKKQSLSHLVSWGVYLYWPEQFELLKLKAKREWLETLLDASFDNIVMCRGTDAGTAVQTKLAQFEDTHCQSRSKSNFIWGTIETDCTTMKTTLNLDFLELNMTHDINNTGGFGPSFQKGTVKIAAEAGLAKWEKGPVTVEAKAGAYVEVELSQSGVEDINVGVETKISVGSKALDKAVQDAGNEASIGGKDVVAPTTIDAGAEGRISLITGTKSLSQSGILALKK